MQLLFGLLQLPADVEHEIEELRAAFMRVNNGRSTMGWRGPSLWDPLSLTVLPIAVWLIREVIKLRRERT